MIRSTGIRPENMASIVRSPFTGAPTGPDRGAGRPARDAVSLSGIKPAAAPPEVRPGGGLKARNIALAAVLTLGGMLSTFSGSVALAAEPAASVSSNVVTAADEALAQRAGLTDHAVAALKADPALRARARALPSDFADLYGRFNPRQKKVIFNLIEGKTHFLFVTIHNREAFINGSVAGTDAFPQMLDKIDDQVDAGHLTRTEGDEMKASMSKLKPLTPQQRETIARLIEVDQGTR